MKTLSQYAIAGTMMLGLLTFAACGGGEDGSSEQASSSSSETTSTEEEGGSSTGLKMVEEPGENWGTLTGSVKFEGSAPDPVTAPRNSQCGIKKGDPLNRIKIDEEKGIVQNALVYLDGVKTAIKGELPPKSLTIDQEKCIFRPRWTYLLRKNGVVTVKNSDPELHNFRYRGSSDFGAKGNKNQAPGAKPINIEMNGSEWVNFECNVHPWMIGMMRVSEHHAVARTGDDGSFSFDVEPGDYTLVVNHPELDDPVTTDVTVPKGDSTEQNVSVSFK